LSEKYPTNQNIATTTTESLITPSKKRKVNKSLKNEKSKQKKNDIIIINKNTLTSSSTIISTTKVMTTDISTPPTTNNNKSCILTDALKKSLSTTAATIHHPTKSLINARKEKLDEDERNHVLSLFSSTQPDEVVIDKYNVEFLRSKLVCLQSGQWLNDEVINFYMNMLMERNQEQHKIKVLNNPNAKPSYYFNSFFVSKLYLDHREYDYKSVRRWTKKFNIFDKEKIYFPINLDNTHWTLAIVYITKKEIRYFDSQNGNGTTILKQLLNWVVDEAADKGKTAVQRDEWRLLDSMDQDVPQQHNGYDCGVFSIMFADFISDDLPLDRDLQNDMEHFRMMIAIAITRGFISY
jgi:sentrin-specific protease 1